MIFFETELTAKVCAKTPENSKAFQLQNKAGFAYSLGDLLPFHWLAKQQKGNSTKVSVFATNVCCLK
jgi:hypothetical protein